MKPLFLFSIVLIQSYLLSAQRLKVISTLKQYKKNGITDSIYYLKPIDSTINIKYDLRYSTTTNFTHKRLYPAGLKRSFLLNPSYKSFNMAAEALLLQGYGIVIYDAYRPYATTVAFWNLYKDERYVANPAKGSGHNRGLSIDLSLYDISTNQVLDMGTGFDSFSDTAHHDFLHLPKKILENRLLLKTAMEKAGFIALDTEWWHYAYPNKMNAPVLNISFRKLEKLQNRNRNN